MFDSFLKVPSGRNLNQNAWMTLHLKIKVNFVDGATLSAMNRNIRWKTAQGTVQSDSVLVNSPPLDQTGAFNSVSYVDRWLSILSLRLVSHSLNRGVNLYGYITGRLTNLDGEPDGLLQKHQHGSARGAVATP
jgi:hypothetical protein